MSKAPRDPDCGVLLDHQRKRHGLFLVIFLGVTAKRGPGRSGNTYTRPGALYRSTDSGEHWTNILVEPKLYWPGEFVVHPKDPDTIYLAVHTATRRENGGVYRTTDGGKTWQRFLNNQSFRGKGGPN